MFHITYNVKFIDYETGRSVLYEIQLHRVPQIGETIRLVLHGDHLYKVKDVITNINHDTLKSDYEIILEK